MQVGDTDGVGDGILTFGEDSKPSQLQTLRGHFIDLIDAKKQELIWQGEGVGYIT
jgi:hypothetical protein